MIGLFCWYFFIAGVLLLFYYSAFVKRRENGMELGIIELGQALGDQTGALFVDACGT